MNLWTRASVLSLLLLLGAGEAKADLIVDGDFSQAVLTTSSAPGWTITGNMAIYDSATACCHTGTTGTGNFVNIGGGNGLDDGVISQSFATVAGHTYVLNFLYGAFSSPAGVGTQSIEVTVGDLDMTIVSALSERDHSKVLSPYEFEFDATGSTTTLTFTDRSTITNSIDGFLDSVSVVDVPEPASISIIAPALLGFGWAIRRRGSTRNVLPHCHRGRNSVSRQARWSASPNRSGSPILALTRAGNVRRGPSCELNGAK